MSEMVERVAAAMYRANPENERTPFCKAEMWLQDQARDMARAAIEALREPTEAMLDCPDFPYSPGEALQYWRAMMSAALPQEGGER